MLYELISENDYEGLPEEPDLKFVAFEAICRSNMTRLITENTTQNSDHFVRLQYMAMVAGVAEALGIEDVKYPDWLEDPDRGLDAFMLAVSRQVARIRLRANSGAKALSVRLGEKTRGRIEQQIQKLRVIISAEAMPEEKRKALLSRLDELSIELSQSRVSFAKVMAVLAQISIGVATGTTFLAEAPHAIATISSLLGADKAAEEAEVQRLGVPAKPKALPSPPKPKASTKSNSVSFSLDDGEIPF